MGYPIYTTQGLSTAAYTKTANLITGRNQFLGKGRLQVWGKGSAIGMNITVAVGGVALMDDLPVPAIGTTGSMSTNDNAIIDQVVAGGVSELYFRNTTVGALTMDCIVTFTPMK